MTGQEPEERPSAFDPESSAGLFVGISTFEDVRFQQVPYAVDDAVDLANLFVVDLGLVRPEKAVLLLAGEPQKSQSSLKLARLMELGTRRQGARQSDIYRSLTELTVASGPQGLILLTIATHGISDQGGDFLVASDSLPNRALRTGIAVSELFDEVARSHAKRRLVLLDACRERLTQGTRSTEDSPMAPSFADAIARANGSVILSGATLGGFAYDDTKRKNGVFTAAVLDGLGGLAPAGGEGWITVRTLADYVQQRVVAWVQRNRPEHASKSLGIGRQIDATADSLPLALHPQVSAERRLYRSRREAALERLARNQGKILTGAHWDQIAERLPAESPGGPEVGQLLDEIEALDGTERSQRSLRDFFRENLGTTAPPPPLPDEAPTRSQKPRPQPMLSRFGAMIQPVRLRIVTAMVLAIGLMYGSGLLWVGYASKKNSTAAPISKPAPVTNPRVALDTDKGRIIIELDPVRAQPTVRRFLSDVAQGKYDKTAFMGIRPGLLDEDLGTSWDSGENSLLKMNQYSRGSVIMEDTNSSGHGYMSIQVRDHLPFKTFPSVLIGKVVVGMDVADALAADPEKLAYVRKAIRLPSEAPQPSSKNDHGF